MGGTSTDVALVQGAQAADRPGDQGRRPDGPRRRRWTYGRSARAAARSPTCPQLTKALRVGPQSAGAEPGPAAYGKGGSDPTVTDANVVLGYLPTSLAGGEITLDAEAARSAVQTVADAMGLASAEEAAAGIVDIVNENMLGGLRLVSVQQGFDPRDFALVAFGGAGPLHANALGQADRGVAGHRAAVAGRAVRPGRRHHVRPGRVGPHLPAPVRRPDRRRAGRHPARPVVGRVRPAGRAGDRRERAAGRPTRSTSGTSARASTSPVDVRPAWLEDPDEALRIIGERFDAEHERLFSFVLPVDHELVNARASVSGPRPKVTPTAWNPAPAIRQPRAPGRPASTSTAACGDAALYDRTRLRAGDVLPGPAIVTEMDSTTLVLPGHVATVDRWRQPADPPRRRPRREGELSHGHRRAARHHRAGPGRRRTRSPST